MTQQKFRVSNELGMWLRSAPVVDETTQKVLLPKGQLVNKLGESETADWWRISTHFKDIDWEGVSKRTLMVPDSGFVPTEGSNRITPVHLQRSSPVMRNQRGTEAFRLNEQPQPSRDANGTAAQKAEQLGQVIDWLRVSENKRYKPTESATFCNIYAYDYCCLAGAYLPRVWWTPAAINKLMAGQPVNPTYGVTVEEITANQLTKWFRNYGQIFGWRQTTSLTDLQLAANAGAVCIINAMKIVGHGHICAIAPETASHKAEWDASHSRVTKPLTSQAGRQVFEYRPYVWWNENYRDLGFWIHD